MTSPSSHLPPLGRELTKRGDRWIVRSTAYGRTKVSSFPKLTAGEQEYVGWLHAKRHSERFRTVSNRYPRRVAEAYDGDLRRAMADSDEQVAATVAAWEQQQGLHVRDWLAVGAGERAE